MRTIILSLFLTTTLTYGTCKKEYDEKVAASTATNTTSNSGGPADPGGDPDQP